MNRESPAAVSCGAFPYKTKGQRRYLVKAPDVRKNTNKFRDDVIIANSNFYVKYLLCFT